jgi:putative chitinase
MITRKQFGDCFPHAKVSDIEKYWPYVQKLFEKYQINTPRRICAFSGQLAHESMSLSKNRENLNYTSAERLLEVFPKDFKDLEDAKQYIRNPEKIANRVYQNTLGNGPESSGDGWKYAGKGPLQITLKDNYRWIGNIIKQDLINHPELLETPEFGLEAACAYWRERGLNRLADIDSYSMITKKINAASEGSVQRQARWEEAKKALGVVI